MSRPKGPVIGRDMVHRKDQQVMLVAEPEKRTAHHRVAGKVKGLPACTAA